MNESTVTITVADGVMHVAGEIDMYSATCLDSALADVGCPQLVDMSAVSFMDCAGLNALTRHHRRRVEQGEALRVVAMSRAVERVLEVSGLLPMLAAESATAARSPCGQHLDRAAGAAVGSPNHQAGVAG